MKNRKRRLLRKKTKQIKERYSLTLVEAYKQQKTNSCCPLNGRQRKSEKEQNVTTTIISGKKLRHEALLKRMKLEQTQLQVRRTPVDVVSSQ
jgi:hypothetical protein